MLKKLPHQVLPEHLTPTQVEILTGHLLGDGCLYRRRPTHLPYFSINRVRSDRAYSEWTAEAFSPFSLPLEERSVPDKRTDKVYEQVSFKTRRSEVFSAPYAQWYLEGIKVLPEHLPLTPLTLAVWFCDDGNVRTTCAPHRFQLKLSTMGFTSAEVERLAEALRVRFGEHFHPVRDGDKFYLNAADSGTRAFLREIDPVLPEGMLRKAVWRAADARFYEDQPEAGRTWLRNKVQLPSRGA